MPNTLKRGLFHIFGGLSIVVAGFLLPRIALLISLGIATAIFLTFELIRFRASTVNEWFLSNFRALLREEESSRLTGTSYMLVASIVAFLVFDRDVAIIALSFLAVGDAVATIVGKLIGKRRLLGKTLEGDLACLFSCIATGLVFHYVGFGVPLPNILVGAASATIVEAIGLPINDNLTMPLLAGLAITLMSI